MVSRNTFLSAIRANDRPDLRRVYADWLEEQGDSKNALAQRETADEMETRWGYSGDIDLSYGGAFIDVRTWDYGYCDAVRVTDLGSACGADGMVLIEHVTILVGGNDSRDSERMRRAMASCCGSLRGCKNKTAARRAIAEAVMSYGHCDPDEQWAGGWGSHSEIVQTEADGPMVFDGWRADKRLRGTTLGAYVKSVHLGE